jgi:hypothetical protein
MNHSITKNQLRKIIRFIFFLVIILLISPNLVYSQTEKQNKQKSVDPTFHHEVMGDEYVPDLREIQGRSPAYNYRSANIITTQVNVDANGQNIVGDAANEPSIAIDPTNPNRMAIGWRQFNTVTNNFRQAGFGYTTNGGQTWTFPGVIEPGIFRSDPVLGSDVNGNFYYNSLTNSPDYQCKVFKSSTGGSTWNSGVFAQGGDKQWMTIDKTDGPGEGHIYAFWTSWFSTCSPDFFTRSTNAGSSFENCTSIPNDPSWGTLAVGSNGELYVAGTDGFSNDFIVAKSLNAQNAGQTVTWNNFTVVSLDGIIAYGIPPNPGGLGGQTIIAVDTSGGPYHGYVYLLCSVDRNSNSDPADIMFARSTNGGLTWSSPVRVNDDAGSSAYQWFGTMSVAPSGRIDAIWLDTRNNPSNTSALYYSYSTNAGVTWSANVRLSDYFNSHLGWPNQDKMGDYFDMISDYTGAHLAWAGTFNGEQDVYYSYIYDSTFVPVELVSFTASSAGNIVTLNWLTATEINNRGFEIERSGNKTNWILIGFKEGNGTISEPQHYTYSDFLENTNSSTFYYRLKQIDFDGSFRYSEIIEVEITPTNYSLSQNYPNPFNPTTNFKFQIANSGFVSMKVFDVLGNEVANLVNEELSAGEYEVEYNASGLPSGVYFYKLSAGSFTDTKKMILMK